MSDGLKWLLVVVVLAVGGFFGYQALFPADTVDEDATDNGKQVILDMDNQADDDISDNIYIPVDDDSMLLDNDDTVVDESDIDEDSTPTEDDATAVVSDSISGAKASDNATISAYNCETASGVFTFQWTTASDTGEVPSVKSATVGNDIVVTFESLSRDRVAALSNSSSLCGTKPTVTGVVEGEVSKYTFVDYASKKFELSADKANNMVYLKISL